MINLSMKLFIIYIYTFKKGITKFIPFYNEVRKGYNKVKTKFIPFYTEVRKCILFKKIDLLWLYFLKVITK